MSQFKTEYVIRVVRKDNGAHIFSHTGNYNQRIARLKENINSINGKGSAVFDRFTPFIGCTVDDVEFEVYTRIA